MSEDEQEALSHKYHAHGILALESGAWALFSPDRKLIGIFSSYHLKLALSIVDTYKIKEPEHAAPVQELNLEDLGL